MNTKDLILTGIRGIFKALNDASDTEKEILDIQNCKFNPDKPCIKKECPAWFIYEEGGICAFDIATTMIQELPKLKNVPTDKIIDYLKKL